MDTFEKIYKSYMDKIESIEAISKKSMNDMVASLMEELGVKEWKFCNEFYCYSRRASYGPYYETIGLRLVLRDDGYVYYVYCKENAKNCEQFILLTEMKYEDAKEILKSLSDYVARSRSNKMFNVEIRDIDFEIRIPCSKCKNGDELYRYISKHTDEFMEDNKDKIRLALRSAMSNSYYCNNSKVKIEDVSDEDE